MKLSAVITVTDSTDLEEISRAFEPEEKRFTRSSFEIKNTNGKLEFHITAEDSTALRATLNAITKLLTVHEKSANIK
ncbi:hypothetical protein KY330_02270 [Candidatus Woesearchaeota archaeon]|nr:hypothetical protein [Candidatus Woesearchaeota archaeon]